MTRRTAPPPVGPAKLAYNRGRIISALERSTRPQTASQLQQYAINNALGAAHVRRILDGLVAEGRVRRFQTPGHTAVSAPLTVYEAVYKTVSTEGGAS